MLMIPSMASQDEVSFSYPVEAGDDVVGIITLRAAINGVAAHDIMVRIPNTFDIDFFFYTYHALHSS